MRKGFTLVELIIVVIVIGILATVAVPQYLKVTERAKGAKARNALALIAGAEKQYRLANDAFIDCDSTNLVTNLGTYVEMDAIVADTDWSIMVTNSTDSSFLVRAFRATGSNNGESITLNQDGVWGGTFDP